MDETEAIFPVGDEAEEDAPLDAPIMGDETEVGDGADEEGPKDGELPPDAF